MGYLEWLSSYDEQRRYQATVPQVCIPNEAINQWEDWFYGDWDLYSAPEFSVDEQTAMRDFHKVWGDVAHQLPEGWPALDDVIGSEPWEQLRAAAEAAYLSFANRAAT